MKRHLTTGEIATICGVAPRTAMMWIDRGQLAGFRLPGMSHRRVEVSAMRQFLVANQMPEEWLDRFLRGKEPRPVDQVLDNWCEYTIECNDAAGLVRALLKFLSQVWPTAVCETMLDESPPLTVEAYVRAYLSDTSYKDISVYSSHHVAAAAVNDCTADVVERASVTLFVVDNQITIGLHGDNRSVVDWITRGDHGFVVGELKALNHA